MRLGKIVGDLFFNPSFDSSWVSVSSRAELFIQYSSGDYRWSALFGVSLSANHVGSATKDKAIEGIKRRRLQGSLKPIFFFF